ncbi:MAG: alpha-galactosidase [Lentisphaeria bacterium]|nr:alpha-galactosidase [Lentisphaeria bacterium]
MSYSWSQVTGGYRASFQVDFAPGTFVYRVNPFMIQLNPLPALTSDLAEFGDITSTNVIVVGKEDHFILAGAVTAFRSLTIFRAVYDTRRIIRIEMEQPDIHPDEKPEETVILEGTDWRELLFQYADIAAQKMGAKPISAEKNLTGYCSWYYYYKDVSEEHMLENIDALAKNRSPYAAEYVQIDDGYQTFQGDWLDQCDEWPVPVREVAAKIISHGMKAGIWLMPTTASTQSRIFREHPEWFVKNEQGIPVTQVAWGPDDQWGCLDATIPEVREHIVNIFKTFYSWGFTYFKLDGLYFGLQRGIRKDPGATPVSAFRLLLKTIRDAVPDAMIMGCSEPLLPCVGLIDNGRVSNDTSRYFRAPNQPSNAPELCNCSIIDAFHLSMANFWLFDRWFRADPDSMMVRQDNAYYTRNQAKISVLSGIMSGVALTSDHLGTINPDRNALLAKAQDIRMKNARPMRSIANQWPMEFEGTIDGKHAVALINDTDTLKTWTLAELNLPEICTDLLDEKKVIHEISIDPGDAVLLMEA